MSPLYISVIIVITIIYYCHGYGFWESKSLSSVLCHYRFWRGARSSLYSVSWCFLMFPAHLTGEDPSLGDEVDSSFGPCFPGTLALVNEDGLRSEKRSVKQMMFLLVDFAGLSSLIYRSSTLNLAKSVATELQWFFASEAIQPRPEIWRAASLENTSTIDSRYF